jgi:hypothetical protein
LLAIGGQKELRPQKERFGKVDSGNKKRRKRKNLVSEGGKVFGLYPT